MKNMRYKVNDNYFQQIDTQDKAYILGLFYSDGFVTTRNRVGISLNEKDVDILLKIKKCMEFEGPIGFKIPVQKIIKSSPLRTLSISSEKIHADLIRLGCTPRKSLSIQFPTEEQVPTSLINHFIRGYFDGDGSISKLKIRPLYHIAFCGNPKMLSTISELLQKSCGIKIGIVRQSKTSLGNNSYLLQIGGNERVFKLCEFLFKDANLYLERKYNIYKEMKNYWLNYLSDRAEYKHSLNKPFCTSVDCDNVVYNNKQVCRSCFDKQKQAST